jgi:hypothetical protein
MDAKVLLEKLSREPFTPLWLYLSDGRKIDVENPDIAVISNMGVYVFKIKRGSGPISDDTHYISLRHIVSIEDLQASETV